MKYSDNNDVEERIEKNYQCLNSIEKLLPLIKNDNDKLELISLIGKMYSEYVTGVYASGYLEKYICELGEKISIPCHENKDFKNKVLIVMSKAYYTGGHTVLVHNWIKWDDKRTYSIVFTDSDIIDVPDFIREVVKKSGGYIKCLKGNYYKKAQILLNVSMDYERVILFTHMNDVVPLISYSNKMWNRPVYFYNHADFKFSFGFSVADAVLNLGEYDVNKSVRYRGVEKNKALYFQFPGQGKMDKRFSINLSDNRKEINEKYKIEKDVKLIVSMGADFKYTSVIDYEFDEYVRRLMEIYEHKCIFLIIGADKDSYKWIKLEKDTNGRARALGILEREEAEKIISAADLFVVSFPMMSSGRSVATSYNVPYLCLNIIGRSVNENDIRVSSSVDQLLDKTIDILNGNAEKYMLVPEEKVLNKQEWNEEWTRIYTYYDNHRVYEIKPHRFIEKQEIINCQLMQENAGLNVYGYLKNHHINEIIIRKIMELDINYDMGIYKKDILYNYNQCIDDKNKNYLLYQTSIKWVKLKQKKVNIAEYLLKQCYSTFAIYGMGYMGQTLAEEFISENAKVLYGIDRNAGNLKGKIKIFKPTDIIEPVDLIINTTTIDNSNILDGMKEKNVHMIKFDDLLNEIIYLKE